MLVRVVAAAVPFGLVAVLAEMPAAALLAVAAWAKVPSALVALAAALASLEAAHIAARAVLVVGAQHTALLDKEEVRRRHSPVVVVDSFEDPLLLCAALKITPEYYHLIAKEFPLQAHHSLPNAPPHERLPGCSGLCYLLGLV